MADCPICGWQLHLVDDTIHHSSCGERRGARWRSLVSDTARCGTSRFHPTTCFSDKAITGCRSIALESRRIELGLRSRMDSRFVWSPVIQPSTGHPIGPLNPRRRAQDQSRDRYVTFEPSRRLRPRPVTSREGIHLHREPSNLRPTPASIASHTSHFFYHRWHRKSLHVSLGRLRVARYPLCLGRGTSSLASMKGGKDTHPRPAVRVSHTKVSLFRGQRYAPGAALPECRIHVQTRRNALPCRLPPRDLQLPGTYLAFPIGNDPLLWRSREFFFP